MQKITSFFKNTKFITSVNNIAHLKEYPFVEIAFWGRSNVGKSSILNAIVEKDIAKVSNTPGRTQMLNIFNVADKMIMVDMPGYGFAKAPLDVKIKWEELISNYLKTRTNLKLLYLLIDARHGIKDIDKEIMDFLSDIGVIFQIVLTKTDKISSKSLQLIEEGVLIELKKYSASTDKIISTSIKDKKSIQNLSYSIADLI